MKSRSFYFSLIFLFVIIFSSKNASAQQKSLSISLSYPITIGDTFFSNYDGIAGLDIEYAYPINNNFSVGGKLGYSRSKYSYQSFKGNTTTFSNLYRGQIFLSAPIEVGNQFSIIPQLGLGYAFIKSKNDDFQNQSLDGINPAFSLLSNLPVNLHFDLSLFWSYEFIYLGKPDVAINTPYNKEMHYINVGAKFLLKL